MIPPKKIVNKQLGELLKDHKIITEEQLAEALNKQKQEGGLIGEILVALGYAKEEEIAQALTIQYGFPFLPLQNYEIDQELINILPADIARKYGVIDEVISTRKK